MTFLELLDNAKRALNVENVVKSLKKMCKEALKKGQRKVEKDSKISQVIKEMDLFFGPSKVFSEIFRYCILK